jgi:adenine deaminase
MSPFTVSGKLVDVHLKKIYPAEVTVHDGKILSIKALPDDTMIAGYILPGFVDSHVHIESSMLVPAEFARLAVIHGTVATVSDPHEIANVCGIAGVEFMINNGHTVPFKFNFGAPSCVPATPFETAGARLDAADVEQLLQRKEIRYLSEMMNFPGVLNKDEEVLKKIAAAKRLDKPVDGHAPGLRGEMAKRYIDAGISTDHECFTPEEALEKLNLGMKILIREGSAAKNFEALIPLLHDHADHIMFCSDDKHPDSLVLGHINQLCARAAEKNIAVFKIVQAACVNPVLHYKLDVGLLRENDPADFIVVSDLETFTVLQTYIDGQRVASNGQSHISQSRSPIINNFCCHKKTPADFRLTADVFHDYGEPLSKKSMVNFPVIEALDGQLITNRIDVSLAADEFILPDIKSDILKIAVVNRYREAPAAVAFIKNTGLKQGAIASSVAHDCHNIVAVGVDDESICKAVNMIIEHKGGISCVNEAIEIIVPLPVAGLMSAADGFKIAQQYAVIDKAAKDAGATLSSPFMTLSFMALLVIPHIKLSDLGLFDGDRFDFVGMSQS